MAKARICPAGLKAGPGTFATRVFQCGQGTSWWGRVPPVHRDHREQRCSMRFHFEVPGGKWQTAMTMPISSARRASPSIHGRRRYPLQPPGAGTDEQVAGLRVGGPNVRYRVGASRRRRWRVVFGPHRHPPLVSAQVEDAVGDRLGHRGIPEVVDRHILRLPLGPPGVSTEITGSPVCWKWRTFSLIVAELGVAVRMLGRLQRLGVGLLAVVEAVEDLSTRW